MLDKIHQKRKFLSKSEKLVADIILEDAESALRTSIQSMAKQAGVSEPTVIRFCRALGANGFHEFKLRLAKNLGSQDTFFFQDISDDDDCESLSKKIIDSTVASLVQVREQLDYQAVERAIQLYRDCDRVEFYGSGGSGVVAEDAQLKFFRLGKPAVAYSDPHIQNATAALLDPSALVIAISASGQNKDLIHTLGIVQQTGAHILAITAANSTISELAEVALSVDVSEDSDVFSPVKSRLVQMVILDILAVGVGARGGDEAVEKLARAKQAIDFKFQPKR